MKRERGQTLRFSAASLSDGSHCAHTTWRVARQRILKGVIHAINEYPPDQGGTAGPSFPWWDTGEVSNGRRGGDQEAERAAPGDDLWLGALVSCGACEH
jgi:hypothetical protein